MSTIEMDELRDCAAKRFAEIDRLKAELEKAQACAAEMRSVLEFHKGTLSYDDHDCLYRIGSTAMYKHALSTYCGVGWLSPEKVKELNDEIGNLRERVTHSEQAALEMAEKVDELKAENQLMRESLQRIATNPSAIASQHIARETLDKLKGQ